MATTVLQAFQTLKTRLEITGLQVETVSTRQRSVRDVMAAGLSVQDDFLTGSYSRKTMIAPLKDADVDIFVVLDVKYFHHYNHGQNGGQAGLLELTKNTLLKTYTRTPDVSRNGQAVTIRFEDFVVDVIPAFCRQGGGYFIPNSLTADWISTDPKKHIEILTQANMAHDGNLVPLVKMIKGWNRTIGRHFRSFHLEVMALSILNNVSISDFPSGVRYFFDKARLLITQQNLDPAGYGGDVGSYLNTPLKLSEAEQLFQKAYERAVTAERHAAQGHISSAFEAWGEIFGAYFPAIH